MVHTQCPRKSAPSPDTGIAFSRLYSRHLGGTLKPFLNSAHFLCIKVCESGRGDEMMMKSRATFVPSLHNTAQKYNPSSNLENISVPAVLFSTMPFWISIQSDLTAQLIKTSVFTELLTRSQKAKWFPARVADLAATALKVVLQQLN